jgi:2-hydroxychromene-2-carboxylate isomerase
MAGETVRFYFDFVSPNAYLAWTQLPALAARHGAAIEPVPVLFAGLLEAHGQLGPAEMPAKTRWMVRNNLRKAARLGVALNPPAFHPFNPLLALRACSLPLAPAPLTELVGALFRAVWVDALHVSDAAVVTGIANAWVSTAPRSCGGGAARGQGAVGEHTDAAIARGVSASRR